MIVGLLLPLVLVAAVVGVVVLVRRRHEADPHAAPGSSGQSVRRFFQYLLLLGLLVAAASGVTGLLGRGLDRLVGGDVMARDESTLALQLTFTLIALPLWLGLAWWTWRRAAADRRELASLGWAAYLTLAGLVALVTAVVGWTQTLWALTGVRELTGSPVALAVVWTVVWGGHLWWGRQGTPREHLRLRDLLSALVGLAVATYGLAALVGVSLRLLTGLQGESIVGGDADPLLRAGALLLVGAAAWTVHWLLDLARGPRTTGWLTLVLLAGVGGGLLLAVTSLSVVLHQVLVWLVGDPRTSEATEHFAAAPATFGAAVAGLVVWWYHQAVLEAGRAGERTEVRRVYEYLMSAVGLLAAAGGLVMVLVTVVEAIAAGGDLVVEGSAVNTLLAALVLLAVGIPLWLWHWRLAQRARASDPAGELRSVTRRTYLLVLFGVMGIAAVVSLLVLVYLVLTDVLAGEAGVETLRRIRFPLGVLLTTSLLSAYHWTIFRADREESEQITVHPATSPAHRRVLLVGALSRSELAAVGGRTGSALQQWAPLDGSAGPSADEVVAALEALPDPTTGAGGGDGQVLVLRVDGGVHAIPVAVPGTPSGRPTP